MGKQTYIREETRYGIYRNFKKTYRKMLIDDVTQDIAGVDKMLNDNKALFDKIVEITFKDDPCENYLKEYERKTGDKCLRNYIEIYKAFIDETSHALYDDDGTYFEEWVDDYFNDVNQVINKVYKALESDCQNGFHWWKKENESPEALRRQLKCKVMFFNKDRINALCKKYIGREYDLSRMSEKKYNESLVIRLDRAMEANGKKLVYTYPSIDKNGKKIICRSDKCPNVPYYKFEYKTKTKENVNNNKGRE